MRMHRLRPALAIGLVLALGSCSLGAKDWDVPERYQAAEVPAAMERAREELVTPESTEGAVKRMAVAVETSGLTPSIRLEAQRLFERSVEQRIAELVAEGDEPAKLRDLSELEVARRIAVSAGMASAYAWRDKGERVKCFRQIRSLDERFPLHSMRQKAGQLLAEVGLDLATDRGRYALFFRYSALAPQVLEYLITEYPSDPSGPQAIETLAELYERSGELELALLRHEDLLLYFPSDPRVPSSQAAIPRLRLAQLKSPEYDRKQMTRARLEIEDWLSDYPEHPLQPDVRLLLADCLGRLADNDLVVARFYRRVGNAYGAEYHARRALDIAREAGDETQIDEATQALQVAVEMAAEEA